PGTFTVSPRSVRSAPVNPVNKAARHEVLPRSSARVEVTVSLYPPRRAPVKATPAPARGSHRGEHLVELVVALDDTGLHSAFDHPVPRLLRGVDGVRVQPG